MPTPQRGIEGHILCLSFFPPEEEKLQVLSPISSPSLTLNSQLFLIILNKLLNRSILVLSYLEWNENYPIIKEEQIHLIV